MTTPAPYEPKPVDLRPQRVAVLRYEGSVDGLADHWRRFHEIRDTLDESARALVIAYLPPTAYGAPMVVELCLPVEEGAPLPEGMEEGKLPGGRFVLASGPGDDLAAIYRAARRYANERGMPVERGGIEFYRSAGDGESPVVEAGYRVHE